MSQYCLEPVDANFAQSIQEQDILVAGENFGCGSAREIAPKALKHLKVGAIIAKSYARTFFRNAIAIGLPVLISQNAFSLCNKGDVLEIDLKHSKIKNLSNETTIDVEPIDHDIFQILLKGGIFLTLK
jgi:3-isopropylmalate dehydratase small subunit